MVRIELSEWRGFILYNNVCEVKWGIIKETFLIWVCTLIKINCIIDLNTNSKKTTFTYCHSLSIFIKKNVNQNAYNLQLHFFHFAQFPLIRSLITDIALCFDFYDNLFICIICLYNFKLFY